MFALKSLVKTAPAVSRLALQTRTSVTSGPARNKVPFLEKVGLGSMIVVGTFGIPIWVLVHIKDYQTKE